MGLVVRILVGLSPSRKGWFCCIASDGDGCSAACEVECGFACEKKSEGLRIFSTCTRHCGDGVAINCGGGTPSSGVRNSLRKLRYASFLCSFPL